MQNYDIISNIESVSLIPKLSGWMLTDDTTKLLHHIFQKKFSCKITNTNTEFVNALRRAVTSLIPVIVMDPCVVHTETEDPFILSDLVETRIRLIPIMQNISLITRFELKIFNKTENLLDVMTSDIKIYGNKQMPYNNMLICTLEPNSSLDINIGLKQSSAYKKHAAHTVCMQSNMQPLDCTPLNLQYPVGHKDRGISSLVADPHIYRFGFQTNGTIEPIDAIISACSVIIKRLKNIKHLIEEIKKIPPGNFELMLEGEDDTCGQLLECGIQRAVMRSLPILDIKEPIALTATACSNNEIEDSVKLICRWNITDNIDIKYIITKVCEYWTERFIKFTNQIKG